MKEIVEVFQQPENCYECASFQKLNEFVDGVSKTQIYPGNSNSGMKRDSYELHISEFTGIIGRCCIWEHLCTKEMCDIKSLGKKDLWTEKELFCNFKYK